MRGAVIFRERSSVYPVVYPNRALGVLATTPTTKHLVTPSVPTGLTTLSGEWSESSDARTVGLDRPDGPDETQARPPRAG